jgi:hypothetical protein
MTFAKRLNFAQTYRIMYGQSLVAQHTFCRVHLKRDGTRWRTGGKLKGKLANGVGTLHTTSEHGVSSITTADAHTSAASNRLNWRPRRFKWTRPFRRKTKSGFCACAITFQTQSNTSNSYSTWSVHIVDRVPTAPPEVFLRSSMQMSKEYCVLGHNRFIPHA